jgi:hypothetical protein
MIHDAMHITALLIIAGSLCWLYRKQRESQNANPAARVLRKTDEEGRDLDERGWNGECLAMIRVGNKEEGSTFGMFLNVMVLAAVEETDIATALVCRMGLECGTYLSASAKQSCKCCHDLKLGMRVCKGSEFAEVVANSPGLGPMKG